VLSSSTGGSVLAAKYLLQMSPCLSSGAGERESKQKVVIFKILVQMLHASLPQCCPKLRNMGISRCKGN
jgi:hypothetical protein